MTITEFYRSIAPSLESKFYWDARDLNLPRIEAAAEMLVERALDADRPEPVTELSDAAYEYVTQE